jgi:hypothetical protein
MNQVIRLLHLPLLGLMALAGAQAQSATPVPAVAGSYRVSHIFHVGGEGSWDHLTVDAQSHLLFAPRFTHTMVLDADTGRLVADIPGQKRSHGVAIVHSVGRGFITDGDDASVVVFDLKTYEVLGKIKAEPDADGIIYDADCDKILVASGDSSVLIPISPSVDPKSGHADAAVDLGGEPELLVADGRGNAYINLKNKNQVAVVDTRTMKVLHRWSTAPGGAPVGMGMDRENRRLFIGCRDPKRLIVMNADNGTVLADLPLGAINDAVHFDGSAFASCGDGTISVARETSPGKFEIVQVVKTRTGARTMGLDSVAHTFYLPTVEFEAPATANAAPVPKPDSFMIVVVSAGT